MLGHDEAMRLLASVDYGRLVFNLKAALPAIRPVNHLVYEGRIIIRTRVRNKFQDLRDDLDDDRRREALQVWAENFGVSLAAAKANQ